MIKLARLSPKIRYILNGLVIVGSVLLCIFLSFTRLSGMELLGIGPNWWVIWVVSWSIKRSLFQAVVAGFTLGLIQDGLTSSYPSHGIGLLLVAYLTARLQKQRYIKEDLVSVVIIVFIMTLLAEGVIAAQYLLQGSRTLAEIWLDYQRVALSAAILSSLWTPVLYYPLNCWWEKIKSLD